MFRIDKGIRLIGKRKKAIHESTKGIGIVLILDGSS